MTFFVVGNRNMFYFCMSIKECLLGRGTTFIAILLLICAFNDYYCREIGDGSRDSWFMPLLEQVIVTTFHIS